jgi:ligand-binding sensor domain-containing protein
MLHFQTATKMACTVLVTFMAAFCLLAPSFGAASDALDHPKPIPSGHPRLVRKPGSVSSSVHCQLQDKAGNLWFSTGGEGVYRFDGASFINLTTNDGLLDNDVRSIIEDNSGNIVFGTRSGICKYNGKEFSKYGDNTELHRMPVTCLLADREGNLWIGTLTSGVYRYDGKNLANFLNGDRPFNLGSKYQTIMDILQDKNGNLWFSSWNGGGAWRYDGRSFTNFVPSADYYRRNEDGRSEAGMTPFLGSLPGPFRSGHLSPPDSIGDDMIFSMTEDKAGNLWFATRNHGVCRYDGKEFTSYLGNERMLAALEDSKGAMWFTTVDNGVWRYDGKSFTNFTTRDGLINNSVFSVLLDRSGNLWFGTRNCGLSRYDGERFVSFSD